MATCFWNLGKGLQNPPERKHRPCWAARADAAQPMQGDQGWALPSHSHPAPHQPLAQGKNLLLPRPLPSQRRRRRRLHCNGGKAWTKWEFLLWKLWGSGEKKSWFWHLLLVPLSPHSPAALLLSVREAKKNILWLVLGLFILNVPTRFHCRLLGFLTTTQPNSSGMHIWNTWVWKNQITCTCSRKSEERRQLALAIFVLPTRPHHLGELISPSLDLKVKISQA